MTPLSGAGVAARSSTRSSPPKPPLFPLPELIAVDDEESMPLLGYDKDGIPLYGPRRIRLWSGW